MASPSGYILELTPPKPEDSQYHNTYLHDVFKWKFSIVEPSSIPGFYFRDGKPVHIMRNSKPNITFVSNTSTTTPSINDYVLCQNGSLPNHIRGSREMLAAPRFRGAKSGSEVTLSDLGCKGEYTATVDVPGGDDEPSFRVLPDSGASGLWLFPVNFIVTPELTEFQQENIPRHVLYYPGQSANPHGTREFKAHYLDNSFAKGRVFNDDWKFHTRDGTKLSIRPLFGVADIVHNRFVMSHIDGLLGLGFVRGKHFSGSQPDTFIATLRAKGLIATFKFCICFRGSRVGRSFLSLGYFPPDIPEPKRWISVTEDAKTWIIKCDSIGWGENPADPSQDLQVLELKMGVLLDSGTTHCYFPGAVLNFVRNSLGGRDMESLGSDFFELPSKGWRSGRKRLWISLGGYWHYWPSESLYGDLSQPATPPNEAWYQSRLLCNGAKNKFAILGAAFFEHYFVYFDADPNRPRVALEYQF